MPRQLSLLHVLVLQTVLHLPDKKVLYISGEESASFGKQLNDIGNYNEAQILAGDDGWNPVENGNVLLQNLKR